MFVLFIFSVKNSMPPSAANKGSKTGGFGLNEYLTSIKEESLFAIKKSVNHTYPVRNFY